MMRCEEADTVIADYSVGNLSEKTRFAVEEHLGVCEECARELALLHMVMAAVEEHVGEIEPPHGLWHGVCSRIETEQSRSWLEKVSQSFRKPRVALGYAVATAALAGALIFGLTVKSPQQIAERSPDPAAMEYVQSHASSSINDAFADRVSLGFAASMSASEERSHL